MNKIRFRAVVSFLGIIAIIATAGTLACSKPQDNAQPTSPPESGLSKGIGPIKSVSLEAIDPALAAKGKETFTAKCSACHKLEEKYVGPALKGVTQRRAPEWIMNMMLNPTEMLQKDPIAQELLATYLVQMTFQNVTETEARSILEYFRQSDAGSGTTP